MKSNLQRKLQAGAGIMLMLASFTFTIGCTNAQVNDVLTKIAAEIPTAIAFADTAGPIVATLDPAIAIPVGIAVAAVNAGLPVLQAEITAYLANPNASVLAKIEAAINELITQNTAALKAFGIKSEGTQAQALAVMGSLNAVLIVIDGWIQQIQPGSVTKANAAARTTKLAMVDQYLNHDILNKAAVAQGTTYQAFAQHEAQLGL